MSSVSKNLSAFTSPVPEGSNDMIGIVVAEWNDQITAKLLEGAMNTLQKHGVDKENILVRTVPGSFELPLAASWMITHTDALAVICIGCVVRGETPHFDYICQAVSQGIMNLNLESDTPVVFGVLTVDTMEQAMDRAGGRHGNKGDEAAFTALKMIHLYDDFLKNDLFPEDLEL